MAAAVVQVATPFDQAALLQPVEQADQLAAVELERVGDLACVSRAPSSSSASTL